jgi:hypothetical protein
MACKRPLEQIMFKLFDWLFKEKPLSPGDYGYTYGFKDHDFIRMHFPEKNPPMEEGHLAWIIFDGPKCGDRLVLRPINKQLIERWKKETPGALPIYETGRLEYCKLASAKDNAEIKQYLFDNYIPSQAKNYYEEWLKRLGHVDVSA